MPIALLWHLVIADNIHLLKFDKAGHRQYSKYVTVHEILHHVNSIDVASDDSW